MRISSIFVILCSLLVAAEKHQFDSDVSKVMDILVHSLYKSKDIFVRELISNGADALEKIRLLNNDDLKIEIKVDNNVIILRDNGVGMTKEDLQSNLGTIAKSGTFELIKNPDLIGKFGVGFYSVFLVSDNVVVTSKNDKDEQYVWKSDSKSYTIEKDPSGNTLGRGTEIKINLRDDSLEFGDEKKLLEIIKKHSKFVKFPIMLWSSKEVEEEIEPEPKVEGTVQDESDDGATVEDSEPETPKEKITKTVHYWERVNNEKPLWLRKPTEVEPAEYDDFFKSHFGQITKPLKVAHFKIEGSNVFNVLVYIPEKPPANLLQTSTPSASTVELYVRRILISDNMSSFLPRWLGFLKILIDSDDLPLNVSRENIQTHASLKLVKNKIISKVVDLLTELAEQEDEKEWKTIYENYGTAIKLGAHETESSHRDKLVKLLRFDTSTHNFTTFNAYKERMKQDQPQIYYSVGPNLESAAASPYAEKLIAKGYEVAYFVDPYIEYLAQNTLLQFDKVPLQDVSKPGLKFDDDEKPDEDTEKQLAEEFKPLIDYLQKLLEKKVSKVSISNNLIKTAAVVSPDSMGLNPLQEKMMTIQYQGKESDPLFKFYNSQKKVLELNPHHVVVKKMLEMARASDPKLKIFGKSFYEIYYVASGWEVRFPKGFSVRMERLLRDYLELDQEKVPIEEKEEKNSSEKPASSDAEQLKKDEPLKEDHVEL